MGPEVHSSVHRIWSYGLPNVRVEQPATFRRNYGLAVWHAGFDGACPCAYQHTFGKHIWNDFDTPGPHRDHVFAYPTSDGFREGVDDVRYLTTLIEAIEQAKDDESMMVLVRQAEHWLASLKAGYDISGDLDAIRRQAIWFIVELGR